MTGSPFVTVLLMLDALDEATATFGLPEHLSDPTCLVISRETWESLRRPSQLEVPLHRADR